MRHRDVMVLLHRSCDGPDNACSKNLRFCTMPKHNVPKTGRICTIVQVRLTPEIGCNLWVLSVQDMLGCRSSPLASELLLAPQRSTLSRINRRAGASPQGHSIQDSRC